MMYKRFSPIGLNLDVDPVELPDDYYSGVTNMVPRNGKMMRARGYEQIYGDLLFAPYYLLYSPQLGEVFWLYAGLSNIAVIASNGTHSDITPAAMTQVNGYLWTGGNINGIAVVNSPENPPYYWFNGEAAAAVLPGMRDASTRYNVVRPYKYHLVGLGVTDGGGSYSDALHWSDGADPGAVPGTWIPDAANEAGDNIIADENGAIIDGLSLRDSFIIYKQDSVYSMTYSGGSEVMRFGKLFSSSGILAVNCVVSVGGWHYVLGNGDVYRHDGQTMQSLVNGVVRDAFFKSIDPEYFRTSFVVHSEPYEEIWFCIPTTGQQRPNRALVLDLVSGRIGVRILPALDFAGAGVVSPTQSVNDWDTDAGTWDGDVTSWTEAGYSQVEDSILVASAGQSKIYIADKGVTGAGIPYTANVERLGIMLEDPREKAIRRIWPRINGAAGNEYVMTLYNQRDPSGDVEVLATVPFQTGGQGVAVNVNARYLGIGISSDSQSDWDIAGFDVEYLPRGAF